MLIVGYYNLTFLCGRSVAAAYIDYCLNSEYAL